MKFGMKFVSVLLVAGLVLVSGCAREKYVLLPDESGKTGSLVVTPKDGAPVVLDTPYAMAKQGMGGLSKSQADEKSVKDAYAETLSATPLPPIKFVLYFQGGTDELTPESKQEVDKVFAEIKKRPVPDIVVVGHTDRVGSVPDNDRLALARAQRLQAALTVLGIAAENIQATGRGEREPLVPTDDEVAEPRNRRVEIYVR